MFKKLSITVLFIVIFVSNLYCMTFEQIEPYIGKYVIIKVDLLKIQKEITYVGKIEYVYRIHNGTEYYYTIVITKLNNETVQIPLETIKEVLIFKEYEKLFPERR